MGASEKRKDYISWDEYFMGIAMLSGMRSKDPNTQVGACIVDPEHKILSMGYNGFPLGCSDDEFTWAREGEKMPGSKFFDPGIIFSNIKIFHCCKQIIQLKIRSTDLIICCTIIYNYLVIIY